MRRETEAETTTSQKPRTTLQDVADRAGVSRTTASFVLNDRDDMRISEDAQERVRRAARELDYRPNLMARSLKTQLTHTVALISDAVATDGYGGEMIRGCVEASIAAGHMLFIGEFGGDRRLQTQLVRDFLDRQVDGFVFASTSTLEVDLDPQLLGQPAVTLNCLPKDPTVSSVIPDGEDGGRHAAAHLLGLGHDQGIWLVGETPADRFVAAERRKGIEETLGRAGVDLAGTIECKWWPESAFETMGDFLASGGLPRAIVCLNDRVAMGAYQALKAAGWSIPEDVSVIGFDDSPVASWLQPQLTSVAMPYRDMGIRAIGMLLDGGHDATTIRLPMPIRVRRSTGPPAG